MGHELAKVTVMRSFNILPAGAIGPSFETRPTAGGSLAADVGFSLPSGWWLLPSVLGGAGIWVWGLMSLFG